MNTKIVLPRIFITILFGSLLFISCEDLQTLLQQKLESDDEEKEHVFHLEGPQTVSNASYYSYTYCVWGAIYSDFDTYTLRVDRVSWALKDSNQQILEGRSGYATYVHNPAGGSFQFSVNYQGLPAGIYTLEAIIFLKDGTSQEKILPISVQ